MMAQVPVKSCLLLRDVAFEHWYYYTYGQTSHCNMIRKIRLVFGRGPRIGGSVLV
jgi:hypothetical protein